jgi:hypothetical protein
VPSLRVSSSGSKSAVTPTSYRRSMDLSQIKTPITIEYSGVRAYPSRLARSSLSYPCVPLAVRKISYRPRCHHKHAPQITNEPRHVTNHTGSFLRTLHELYWINGHQPSPDSVAMAYAYLPWLCRAVAEGVLAGAGNDVAIQHGRDRLAAREHVALV